MNSDKNITAVFEEILPDIPNDEYIISGSVAGDPDDPDKVRITLNAIINRKNGEPIEGLTEENFIVLEDGVRRLPLEVSPVSSTSSKPDIMFLIDVSGSMGSEIAGVRDSVVALRLLMERRLLIWEVKSFLCSPANMWSMLFHPILKLLM